MDKLLQAWIKVNDREEGQGLVEYGLIIFLVSIVCVLVLTALGAQLQVVFGDIVGDLGG